MASRLQDVLLRGLAAARPLATAVAKGTLYYSTDAQITEQSDGATWSSYTDTGGGGGSSSAAVLRLAAPYFPEPEEIAYEPQIPASSSVGLTANQKVRTLGVVVDGSGTVLTTGQKGYKPSPWTGTIIGWRIVGDVSGSCVFDIWKDIFANYPPTVADTITAAAKPTVTTAFAAQSTAVGTWNTTVTAGDVFGWNLDSITSFTWLLLEIDILVA